MISKAVTSDSSLFFSSFALSVAISFIFSTCKTVMPLYKLLTQNAISIRETTLFAMSVPCVVQHLWPSPWPSIHQLLYLFGQISRAPEKIYQKKNKSNRKSKSTRIMFNKTEAWKKV